MLVLHRLERVQAAVVRLNSSTLSNNVRHLALGDGYGFASQQSVSKQLHIRPVRMNSDNLSVKHLSPALAGSGTNRAIFECLIYKNKSMIERDRYGERSIRKLGVYHLEPKAAGGGFVTKTSCETDQTYLIFRILNPIPLRKLAIRQ